jgi:hypothetical protein
MAMVAIITMGRVHDSLVSSFWHCVAGGLGWNFRLISARPLIVDPLETRARPTAQHKHAHDAARRVPTRRGAGRGTGVDGGQPAGQVGDLSAVPRLSVRRIV